MAARSQKDESRSCQASEVLGPQVVLCNFLRVLLLKASHEVSPIEGEGKQTPHLVGEGACAKGMGLIISDIFEDSLPK